MSSRSSRKASNPRAKAPEPIITRTKSAQQKRQLKNKEQKTEKPKLTKPEIKSPKLKKTVVCSKQSLLKPVKESDVVEQVEYYPNKLKRDISAKKIMLKPKHNFKVIAATNKRKLATPQRGIKSPPTKHSPRLKSPKRSRISTKPCSSPELSVQDMVRIMEETRSLSDEDFMEILTCPSPVWWEDPPDGLDEDSIHTRSPEPPPKTTETKKRKITTNTTTNKPNNNKTTIEQTLNKNIPKPIEKKDEKFVKKQMKLENVLGNIKNKSVPPKNEIKSDKVPENRSRKHSESEGDISDLSFNEEEILKNLENMDIPIETPVEAKDPLDTTNELKIKQETIDAYDNEIASKNDNLDSEILDIKPEINYEFSVKTPVIVKDSIPESSQFKEMNSDTCKKSDEVFVVDSCKNTSVSNKDSNNLVDVNISSNSGIRKARRKENPSIFVKEIRNENTMIKTDVPKKAKDLSEFITVYKIMPEKIIIESNSENEKTVKLDSVRGKLNNFFKHCKNNVRVKKMESLMPAIPLTDVKQEPTDNEKENGDKKIDTEEKNRLKGCDHCVVKTENGATNVICDKCEMAPILPCGSCNFLADSKEVYRKHVSSCKDVARISWSHNYVMNQT